MKRTLPRPALPYLEEIGQKANEKVRYSRGFEEGSYQSSLKERVFRLQAILGPRE